MQVEPLAQSTRNRRRQAPLPSGSAHTLVTRPAVQFTPIHCAPASQGLVVEVQLASALLLPDTAALSASRELVSLLVAAATGVAAPAADSRHAIASTACALLLCIDFSGVPRRLVGGGAGWGHGRAGQQSRETAAFC